MIKLWRRIALSCIACIVACVCGTAGEEQRSGQPYAKVRYPTFSNKKESVGRLKSLLEADKAEVYDATSETPRIRLENVVITIYNLDNVQDLPKNLPPPVEMLITSDLGFFSRAAPEPGAAIEEIANLEGNVVMHQMRLEAKDKDESPSAAVRPRNIPDKNRESRLPPGVETVIKCEHAQWNHTQAKLVGEGPVEFLQEDSRIVGTNFLYIADNEAIEGGAATSTSDIKDWGGIVFIEHDARMEIERKRDKNATGFVSGINDRDRTVITCKDTASYKLREKEVQFEKDVRMHRSDLTIEADILKVFLRHEDDPLPENPCPDGEPPLPGQVKNIVATIGRRPGSVVITGYRTDEVTGINELIYSAKGGRADFEYDTNRISLTDSREHSWPQVEFGPSGSNRITDGTLKFVFRAPCAKTGADAGSQVVLDSLTTSGGRGEVELRTRQDDPNAGPSVRTRVNYRGEMDYNREDGRIRFTDRVVLKRGDAGMEDVNDLVIAANLLDIKLDQTDAAGAELSRVRRILAENSVDITAGDYTAKAERAEYDIHPDPTGNSNNSRDTLRLFGPSKASVQKAEVKDSLGNVITAPEIHMQRLSAAEGVRDQHLMVARGGVSTFNFVAEPADDNVKAKVISIHCEQGIEYNQVSKKARFEGSVTATSDAPEDNYILTSNRLLIDFEESPIPGSPDEYKTWIRRITAEGNAKLEQDQRVCEAENIIRDFPSSDPREGNVYLQGVPAQGDRMARPAIYREEEGGNILSQFVAPLIKSTSRGDLIQANGPGELSMPDEGQPLSSAQGGNKPRASINFAGAASYESFRDGEASEAKFWGGVRLSQPSRRVVVVSEELDARFVKDDNSGAFTGTGAEVEIERIGRLRRVEARNNVKIVSASSQNGRQTAEGDVGVVEFTGSGNIVRLTANRDGGQRRFVTAKNDKGLTIRSPEIEIREAQGITRAAGPGDLQIPPDSSSEGMAKVPTRVLYGENGAMVYNELALNIRVTNNVRVVQPGKGNNWSFPSLDGICERLDIALAEPPGEDMTGGDALSRVLRMDAIGSVLLRVYAEAPDENPNMDWYSRPGTTFFTRGDQAAYDVPKGEISIFCLDNRQPQLLMNIVENNKPPRRQRMSADRFILFTHPPRHWNFQGQLESSTIRDGEPFDFVGQ